MGCRILISLIAGVLVCMPAFAQQKENKMSEGKSLVAYFSATGTTERVAKMVASAAGADLMEIVPAQKYTDADLDWTDADSRSCRENDDPSSRPAIVRTGESLEEYDVIYLGFPNWWNMAPRIINTFIETYGLKGKTVIPFMTSGGSRIDNSVRILRKDYPEVNWHDGKLLNSATQRSVSDWVKSL